MNARTVIALAAALLALSAADAAHADCMSMCMARFGCGLAYESSRVSGNCRTNQSDCEVECRHATGAGDSLGAIAYSRKAGMAAWSYGFAYRVLAENRALSECAKQDKAATDCEVIVWFNNNCAAIAVEGEGVYWSLGDTDGDAASAAAEACRKDGGKTCAVEAKLCSKY